MRPNSLLPCQVTIVDETALTIDYPLERDVTAMSGCMAELPSDFMASAMDNCNEALEVIHNVTTLTGLGKHIIGFHTTDTSANEANCSATTILISTDTDNYCGSDDLCPGTADGDAVDSNGCSVVQHCPCLQGNWKKQP